MITIAILIDGGFFLKRFDALYGKQDASSVAKAMHSLALKHVDRNSGEHLYRILFYDCRPLEKKAHNPISGRAIDFSKSPQAQFRRDLHQELKSLRKVALRLGVLWDGRGWLLNKRRTKDLLSGKVQIDQLADSDVQYDIKQSGVDMRSGIDIASLALKRMVDRIVLVSGDSDFVPAAKLARREGIDFVLDPMWNRINPSLHEHVDGLKSTARKPRTISTKSK